MTTRRWIGSIPPSAVLAGSLALAQQIARAHGGEIRLLNRDDGNGARATIRLPLP